MSANARLLVVDDEPRLRDSLCALLRNRDYDVRSCDGGQSALGELMAGNVDLMLLDLHLGDMDGLELLAMIRRAGMDTAALVVSGDAVIESAIGALRLEATDYLRKPYDPEEMLHRVDMALQRRALQRSNQQMAQQLRASERIHRFLVEASPDLIFTLDERFRFTFVNERAQTLLGHSAQALQGTSFLATLVPDDAERVRYALERVGSQRTIEFRVPSPDDETLERHFEASLVSVAFAPSLPAGQDVLPSRIYGIARDVTDKKSTEDRLTYLAYHDALTGLPNRALLRDRLGLAIMQAKRNGSQIAIMLADLDRFKIANDTFGHLKGDQLLGQVALRLQGELRETDTLSRMGGDEFAILLPGLRSRDDAARMAAKLVAEVARPLDLDGGDVFLTASIGVAMYPADGADGETLLRHADIAMYHAKSHGKNRFGFFAPDMGENTSRRLNLENEIRRALEQSQFELHYQPQVDFPSRRVVGCEALIRWRHPNRGLVSAGAFLGVVEEIGLISPLTDWVVEEACRTLRSWLDDGLQLARLSVNVPPDVLVEPGFCERLIATVDRHAVPRPSFEIELTENAFVADQQSVSLALAHLAEAGIRAAIDDFGTQYSSLNYLRSLPVSTLKIDQSFVREIEPGRVDSPIIRAVVAIAGGLGLSLVAEGVETELQADYLDSLGAHEMQGYLFGKPMEGAEFKKLLAVN